MHYLYNMFALVDCNNFYASCERVFNPILRQKPIAILSNNDGCIISRSDEAKALGISMGAPEFKVRQELKEKNIGKEKDENNHLDENQLSALIEDSEINKSSVNELENEMKEIEKEYEVQLLILKNKFQDNPDQLLFRTIF